MPDRSCLTDRELAAFTRGQFGEAELDAAIVHIDNCPSCQQRLAQVEDSAMAREPLVEKLGKLRDHEQSDSTQIIATLLQSTQRPRFVGGEDTSEVPSVIGPYVIVRKIAIGGMGTVYEGRHVNLGRSVAIKLLGGERSLSRAHAQQVLIEWRANGRLGHPNIVAATDAGLTANRPYLVTELIDGFDLSVLARCTGPMPLADAATVVYFIAKALEHAHQQGIAHLDIKPSNVMIDRTGVVKVLDLGTARFADLETEILRGSSDDFGTLAYLAPERLVDAMSVSGGRVSNSEPIKSDLYSLGCTFHFLLTGRPPFGSVSGTGRDSSSVVKIVRAHRHDSPPEIEFQAEEPSDRRQREEVQELVYRLTAKAPLDRPANMSEVANATAGFVQQSNLAALVERTSEQQPRLPKIASGQTLELDELISSLETGQPKERKRFRIIWAWGLIFAVLMGCLMVAMAFLRSDTGDETTGQSAPGGGKTPSAVASATANWTWKPNRQVGWLFQSPYLLHTARQNDPSVQHAAYESFAPHSQPIQAEWSSDASLLAVLCANGSLRVYGWSERELRLDHLFNHDGPDIRRFKWHPQRQKLAVASNDHVAMLVPGADAVWSPLTIPGSDITDLEWLVDGNRDLVVTLDETGLSGWDLQGDAKVAILEEDGPFGRIAAANTGKRLAVIGQERLSILRSSYDGNRWKFGLDSEAPLHKPESVVQIRWNRDESKLLVRKNAVAEVRNVSDLNIVGTLLLPAEHENCSSLEFVTENPDDTGRQRRSDTVRLLQGLRCSANRITVQLGPTPVVRSAEKIQSELRGAQLYTPLLVPHPHQELLAVVCMGQVQVWDNSFETVYRGPALSVTAGVQPLQLRSAAAVFQADGRAILVQPNGELACEPIPPVHPGKAKTYFVKRHAIVEPTLDLVQAAALGNTEDSRRNLTQWGLERLPADRTTWTIAPETLEDPDKEETRPYRWRNLHIRSPGKEDEVSAPAVDQAIHSEDRRLSSFDPQTLRYVIGLDNGGVFLIEDRKILWSRVLPELGEERCLLLDPGGKTVFAAGYESAGAAVAAIEASSQRELWRVSDSSQTGAIRMACLGQDELLISSSSHWAVRLKESGDLLRAFDPFQHFGVRNCRVVGSQFDDSLYSCHCLDEIQPACGWSSGLELRWLAFSTGPEHWLVMDGLGREIISVGDETQSAERIVVRRSPTTASWATSICHRPQRSLRILCTHADGRISIQTLDQP